MGEPTRAGADLEQLAVAAHVAGDDDESALAWERAHRAYANAGELDRAARCAFWLAFGLLLRGRAGPASGWLARAERLAAEAGDDCASRGLVLVPAFLDAHWSNTPETAKSLAADIVDIARRAGDSDVLGLGLLCCGEAAIARHEIALGMRYLDDAMVSVTTGDLSPLAAGIVYCGVIEACVDAFDLRRAAEWTDALDAWCAAQPDRIPYRGQCLVHRSQVLAARGAWADATLAAEDARRRLAEAGHPALGAAVYQLGELHRLRGDHAAAERAYRAAGRLGREPSPGFALLRLAQGKVALAVASIQRVVEETRGLRSQPTMLAAAVEVLLAAGDVPGAQAATDELTKLFGDAGSPFAEAIISYAAGSVLLAQGDAGAALVQLRRAHTAWRDLDMPYDAARASVQLAAACRALGDRDAAEYELEAARATFARLGARADLARTGPTTTATSLTRRECEVLRIVATGRTNREIAAALCISEHTVARHLQNIFMKLQVTSRAAATAYAHEHGLV